MSDRPETVVLYHANCPDGFASAWACWTVLGDAATYLPVDYQHPVPAVAQTASRLFIVDFSYPRETLESLADSSDQIVVLDHHKSAAEDLADLPYAKFDMSKSGCILAWEYFHPGESVPLLLRFVDDRDRWVWKLDLSREVSAWIGILDRVFSTWSKAAKELDDFNLRNVVYIIGSGILKAQSMVVERTAKSAWFIAIEANDQTYYVPCVNATCHQSEIGEWLCQLWPESPFASIFYETEQERVWSLRSRGGFDVSQVAKAKGGGGHPCAAGYRERR